MVVIRLFRQSDVFGMVQEIDGCYDSLWQSTAVLAPETRSLTESKRCDVAIVGAGFTGLNAAIGLAEAGHSVCVLAAWGFDYRHGVHLLGARSYGYRQLIQELPRSICLSLSISLSVSYSLSLYVCIYVAVSD